MVYEGGEERTIWTGRASCPEEVKAAVWLAVGRGEHVARVPKDEVVVNTVADLLARWRGHVVTRSDLARRTRDAYVSHTRALQAILGPVLLQQLYRADLDRYRAQAARGGERRARASSTIQIDLVVMDMAWKCGRSIGACPPRDLEIPTIIVWPVRELYTPSAGEVAAVVRRLTGWRADVVALQWATGARIGELAALVPTDVDLGRAELVLGRHEGAEKTGVRRVPLSDDTVPLVRRLLASAQAGQLWPVSVEAIRHHVNSAIPSACKAEDTPAWSTHGLRRAFVVRAVRAGIDVATLATITGHSVQVLLEIYRTVEDEDRRDAMAKLPGRLPQGKVLRLSAGADPHSSPAHVADLPDDDDVLS